MPETDRVELAPGMETCRILNGMWQMSGGHGPIDPASAVRSMFDYHDAGLTTWDLADHYGPAEDFIGEFRRQVADTRGQEALSDIQAFTKWVPPPGPMTRRVVEDNVDLALRRMGVEAIDLMQFHWWEYGAPRYLDALGYLSELRDEGKIRHLGLTNFDTEHLKRIVESGIEIVSNQVQYSLVDLRPEVEMARFCQERHIHLLAYGTVGGGLLSERYLGQPEPPRGALTTASLGKYKQMVDAWGGWGLFQELLQALKSVADKHGVGIANVAVRYILDRPAVAGVIIGARLGVSEHRGDNARVLGLALDEEDRQRIEGVLSRSRDLHQLIGDCGAEYRRR